MMFDKFMEIYREQGDLQIFGKNELDIFLELRVSQSNQPTKVSDIALGSYI